MRLDMLEEGYEPLQHVYSDVGDIRIITQIVHNNPNRQWETAATGERYKDPVWIGSPNFKKALDVHRRLARDLAESENIKK